MPLPVQIDHERAKSAIRAVEKAVVEADFKKFRTVALSAGVMVHQIGLPQFAAFGISKGDEYIRVLEGLLGWLERSDATKQFAKTLNFGDDKIAFMKRLLQLDSSQIAALESESQCYLQWLKRLTEGKAKERKRVKPRAGAEQDDRSSEGSQPE